MKHFQWQSFWQHDLGLRVGFAWIITLYVITMAGMLAFTYITFQSQRSDAVIIDLAGRQRMLNTRHLMQVLLVSQGGTANYRATRLLLQQTLDALTNGGEAVSNLDTKTLAHLPPAPTDAIREKLEEQRQLIETLTNKADVFLELELTSPSYQKVLNELRSLNVTLHTVTDDAVKMLAAESRAKVTIMVEWQVVVVCLVGLLGMLLALQVLRANKEKEREILARQRIQEDLRQSEVQTLHALRQSDTLKSALLSSVSHELRTPLTSIKAMVSRAFDSSIKVMPSPRGEYVQSIHQEIDHLSRLVENLLDMSRIEAGILKPKRDWELLEDLIEGAIGVLGKNLEQRELHLDLEDDLPPLFVDGIQIQQVLINLLENALKYSMRGSAIGLKAWRVNDSVEVHVSNVGEGIPKDEVSKIFDRFYRVRSRGERHIRGTGLGLAICKSLIEAHGGTITVETTVNLHTCFSFTLPLHAQSQDRVSSSTTDPDGAHDE